MKSVSIAIALASSRRISMVRRGSYNRAIKKIVERLRKSVKIRFGTRNT